MDVQGTVTIDPTSAYATAGGVIGVKMVPAFDPPDDFSFGPIGHSVTVQVGDYARESHAEVMRALEKASMTTAMSPAKVQSPIDIAVLGRILEQRMLCGTCKGHMGIEESRQQSPYELRFVVFCGVSSNYPRGLSPCKAADERVSISISHVELTHAGSAADIIAMLHRHLESACTKLGCYIKKLP